MFKEANEMSKFTICPTCGSRMRTVKDVLGNKSLVCDYCVGKSYDTQEVEEPLNIYDIAEIWVSNGRDVDYLFGYSEEEL